MIPEHITADVIREAFVPTLTEPVSIAPLSQYDARRPAIAVLTNSRRYVCRIHRSAAEVKRIELLLPHWRAQRVPQLVAANLNLVLTTWIDGTPMIGARGDERTLACVSAGNLLGRLHDSGDPDRRYPTLSRVRSSVRRDASRYVSSIEHSAVLGRAQYWALCRAVESLADTIESSDLAIVHGDYVLFNWLITPGGVAAVDVANLRIHSRFYDLAKAVRFLEPEDARAFLGGYATGTSWTDTLGSTRRGEFERWRVLSAARSVAHRLDRGDRGLAVAREHLVTALKAWH